MTRKTRRLARLIARVERSKAKDTVRRLKGGGVVATGVADLFGPGFKRLFVVSVKGHDIEASDTPGGEVILTFTTADLGYTPIVGELVTFTLSMD